MTRSHFDWVSYGGGGGKSNYGWRPRFPGLSLQIPTIPFCFIFYTKQNIGNTPPTSWTIYINDKKLFSGNYTKTVMATWKKNFVKTEIRPFSLRRAIFGRIVDTCDQGNVIDVDYQSTVTLQFSTLLPEENVWCFSQVSLDGLVFWNNECLMINE